MALCSQCHVDAVPQLEMVVLTAAAEI